MSTTPATPLRFSTRNRVGEEDLLELLGFGVETAHRTIRLGVESLRDTSTQTTRISEELTREEL